MVGLAEMLLCLSPLIAYDASPSSLFSDSLQEEFFFDILGWIGGFWLLSWVGAICSWKGVAQLGQWLGIVLLSLDQVVLLGVWSAFSHYHDFLGSGVWLAPTLLEVFFLGYFLSIFTMPALTLLGNRTLTGLGALIILLPWLLGRQEIIAGTQFLCGYSHH